MALALSPPSPGVFGRRVSAKCHSPGLLLPRSLRHWIPSSRLKRVHIGRPHCPESTARGCSFCALRALTALCAWAGFGHKAGYLPPPQSIKAQVMAGTLLSSSKEPVAPPPFNPSLSAKKGGASAASSAPSPPPTAVKDDDSAAAPDSSDVSDAAPAKDAPALPVSGMRTPYMGV